LGGGLAIGVIGDQMFRKASLAGGASISDAFKFSYKLFVRITSDCELQFGEFDLGMDNRSFLNGSIGDLT
jgi:hypothetical protein